MNLLLNEVKRHGVKVLALQETKWFGCEVYKVSGGIVLTSGRRKHALGSILEKKNLH